MAPSIHPAATPAERLEALAVRHAGYAPGGPLLAFQASRLAWLGPSRAETWLAKDGGAVVSTLLCYPFAFSVNDADVDGYALGSVGTAPPHRGRGHASRLCETVCREMERRDRPIGLLFSQIPPAFYEAIGFRVIDAFDGRCSRLAELAADGSAAELTALDPRRDLERLCADYVAVHRGTSHVRRKPESFRESIDVGEDDWWFGVRGDAGGYVRIADHAPELHVVEPVLRDPADELPVLRALARLALDLGRTAIVGWLPPSAAVTAWFEPRSRSNDLPMVRGDAPRSGWRIWASDHV